MTDVSPSPDITLNVTPVMTPASRLVVYQILPNNEVAADYLPFAVSASYPMELDVEFSSDEVLPGDALNIRVNTSAPAKVGLVAVDRAVFILAENRLNLRQVFAELERLYAEPQAEFHLESLPPTITTRGAAETFRDAGLVVMTDKSLPAGVESNGSGSAGRRGLLNWLGFGLLLGGVGAGITGTLVQTKRRRFHGCRGPGRPGIGRHPGWLRRRCSRGRPGGGSGGNRSAAGRISATVFDVKRK